eukprot:gene7091-14425_t
MALQRYRPFQKIRFSSQFPSKGVYKLSTPLFAITNNPSDSNINNKSSIKSSKSKISDIDNLISELRTMEKIESKKKPAKTKVTGASKSASSSKSKDNKPVVSGRFVLGSGVEAVAPTNLLGLVRFTAPFHFPDQNNRRITNGGKHDLEYNLDDEDDDDDTFAPSINIGISNGDMNSHQTSLTSSIDYSSTLYDIVTNNNNNFHPNDNSNSNGNGNGFGDPMSWRSVLLSSNHPPATDKPNAQQRVDYFVLCLASHFGTVATYVPTDVDSKIRGHCWEDPDIDVLRAQFGVLKQALHWNVTAVSTKALVLPHHHYHLQHHHHDDNTAGTCTGTDMADIVLSGHSGEFLSVLCGAMGAFSRVGDVSLAVEAETLVHQELTREGLIFKSLLSDVAAGVAGAETRLLKAAAIVTHNVGDVDQGLSYDSDVSDIAHEMTKQRFSRLAHERFDRYEGSFGIAKTLYKELLSAEGHRNYPLREARGLRKELDLQLPLGPWLEQWGITVATHPHLDEEERVAVVRQLLRGCDSTSRAWCVPNQVGYYRALAGFNSVIPLEQLGRGGKALDKDCRELLKTHEVRSQLAVSEEAFAARLARRTREILDSM